MVSQRARRKTFAFICEFLYVLCVCRSFAGAR
ncbi:MAG: hypothetical protein QOH42_2098, partial [Blastocatellia bacterium]|nr:hypothetical protein [Blastocatellia bacterium]